MSSSTDPLKKQPASYREPVLEKLVLNDLIHLSNASRDDKNVLLWMQDRYVNQAITENMSVLIYLVRKGKQEGSTPDEMKRERIETLVRLARETYSSEKSLGRGADLKTYLDAATTFFEAESVRYAGHLKDVSEQIAKAVANGERPDIDRIARTVYGATFKMSGAIDSLERINKSSADAVAKMMENGVKRIEMVAVTNAELNVGRVLYQAIDLISSSPEKYIQFTDPRRMDMPDYKAWDFEPIHRSPGF